MSTCTSNDGEKTHSYVPHSTQLKQACLKSGKFLGVSVWVLKSIIIFNTAADCQRSCMKF